MLLSPRPDWDCYRGHLRTVGYMPLHPCASVMRESRFSGDAVLRACAWNTQNKVSVPGGL